MNYNPEQFYTHFPPNPGYKRQSDGLLRIPPAKSRNLSISSMLMVCVAGLAAVLGSLFWLYLLSIVIVLIIWDPEFYSVIIAILLTVFSIYCMKKMFIYLLSMLLIRDINLNMAQESLSPGESTTVYLSSDKAEYFKSLSIYLIGKEMSVRAYNKSSHPKITDFHAEKVTELNNIYIKKGEKSPPIVLTIPPNVPYSFFESPPASQPGSCSFSKFLVWVIEIEAKFRFFPQFSLEIPLRIGPKSSEESQTL